MSLWQTPQASTLMRTSRAPDVGISRSTISKSPPALGICATFIGVTATFVVAINPPLNFQTLFQSTPCSRCGGRSSMARLSAELNTSHLLAETPQSLRQVRIDTPGEHSRRLLAQPFWGEIRNDVGDVDVHAIDPPFPFQLR